MAKRRASSYQAGHRSRDWIKVKNQHAQEVVIGGYTQGNGSRRGDFGALLVGLPSSDRRKLTFVGKVGTGFSDRGRADLASDLGRMVRAWAQLDELEEMLIEADPATFHVTDHYRDYPIVLARLERLDATTLTAMLERRWRQIAPKKMVREFEEKR